MMIKRRLAISNLLMIALPVLFTCVITAVCLGALFLTLLLNDSPIMSDRHQLEDTSEMAADALEEALEANEDTPTENGLSIADIAHTLSRQGLMPWVTTPPLPYTSTASALKLNTIPKIRATSKPFGAPAIASAVFNRHLHRLGQQGGDFLCQKREV